MLINREKLVTLSLLIGLHCSLMGQCIEKYEGQTSISWSYFYRYPFPNVMTLIGEPDTFLWCSLPCHYHEFEEDNAPFCINLLVYKKDGCWHGTTIQEYLKKRTIDYRLTDTMYMHRDLDLMFSYVIDEMKKSRLLQDDRSGSHSYILARDTTEHYITLIGSLAVDMPDWMDIMPDLSSFVAICLFKTHTTKVLKKYRVRR